MSDSSTAGTNGTEPNRSRPNWGLIVLIVVVIGGAIVAGIVLLSDDDSSESPSSTTSIQSTVPSTSTASDTTAVTTAPTDAPVTTTAPVTTDAPTTTAPDVAELTFSMQDISDGGAIPVEFTCDSDDEAAPTVTIEVVPDGVLQFAMIVDDPDAPTTDPFVHWVVYGISGASGGFSDGDPALTYGVNDAGTDEWFGPCPPEGDGPHDYVFTLYGLDQELTLEPGLDARQLSDAIGDSIVAEGVVTASYERAEL